VDRSFLRSAPFAIATPVAIVSALVYFGFAPAPPERLMPRIQADPRWTWTEWRTPEFFEMRAALDRSDPVATAVRAMTAIRDRNYALYLAHCTERIQRLTTPAILHDNLAMHPLFAFWTSYRVLSVHPHPNGGSLVVVIHLEAEEESGTRAIYLDCNDGGWSINNRIRRFEIPDPEEETAPPEPPPPAHLRTARPQPQ
jgi:hypothetical protein